MPLPQPRSSTRCGTARPQHRQHGAQALLVQPQGLLDGILLRRRWLLVTIGVGVFILEQPRQRFVSQGALVPDIAIDDQLAIGMTGQPSLTAAQQLLDLGLSHPVVLLRVEHRDQHVEVREQILQAHLTVQLDGEVAALAPFRELLVKGMLDRMDPVPERLE